MDINKKLLPSRPSLLDTLAHGALQRALALLAQRHGRICCIDATAGNGHDTCVLARYGEQVSAEICVFACDVQEDALKKTARRLAEQNLRAQLVLCGHETVLRHLPEHDVLGAAVFNLGYLPGKDRTDSFVATQAETTVSALEAFCRRLVPQGCISVHCYAGHAGGCEEYAAVKNFVCALEPRQWRVVCAADVNREHNLEYLFLLEKLQVKQRSRND